VIRFTQLTVYVVKFVDTQFVKLFSTNFDLMDKSFYKKQPVTHRMKKLLRECVEREEKKMAPWGIYYTQSTKGLVERGYGIFKECHFAGKNYMGFFLTEAGIEFAKLVQ
jgi:hypothetical protein